jgi:hypothetical protein
MEMRLIAALSSTVLLIEATLTNCCQRDVGRNVCVVGLILGVGGDNTAAGVENPGLYCDAPRS